MLCVYQYIPFEVILHWLGNVHPSDLRAITRPDPTLPEKRNPAFSTVMTAKPCTIFVNYKPPASNLARSRFKVKICDNRGNTLSHSRGQRVE